MQPPQKFCFVLFLCPYGRSLCAALAMGPDVVECHAATKFYFILFFVTATTRGARHMAFKTCIEMLMQM